MNQVRQLRSAWQLSILCLVATGFQPTVASAYDYAAQQRAAQESSRIAADMARQQMESSRRSSEATAERMRDENAASQRRAEQQRADQRLSDQRQVNQRADQLQSDQQRETLRKTDAQVNEQVQKAYGRNAEVSRQDAVTADRSAQAVYASLGTPEAAMRLAPPPQFPIPSVWQFYSGGGIIAFRKDGSFREAVRQGAKDVVSEGRYAVNGNRFVFATPQGALAFDGRFGHAVRSDGVKSDMVVFTAPGQEFGLVLCQACRMP